MPNTAQAGPDKPAWAAWINALVDTPVAPMHSPMPETKTTDLKTHLTALDGVLSQCMLRDEVRLRRRRRRLSQNSANAQREAGHLRRQADESAALHRRRRENLPAITYPAELPVTARKDEIRRAIQKHPVVIIAGETGSGKTTQIPKICLEAGRGRRAKIAVTQPRRVAAMSLSRRLADELGVEWGAEVGCKIRFRDKTTPGTYIKMMTDGMLLAEIQGDPQLLEYDTIIVDEAHERSLNIDFLLGYLRLLRQKRPDLKIVITSATIDTQSFSKAFGDAPIIEVSGRLFPVEVRHWPVADLVGDDDDGTYVAGAVTAAEKLLHESHTGDLLVFLPSERDIREARELLAGRLGHRRVETLMLFGRLSAAEQQRIFSTGGPRRIVLATNIAETSLTIPGIRYVVDTGMARISRFNPRTQTQRLPIEPIAQSSARQRQGRCGRVTDGVCVFLYDEEDLASRPAHTQPEIQRADLADVILRMASIRLGRVEDFPFIDPPTPQAIRGGYQLLQELGALDDKRQLTSLGRRMARMPLAPTVSRMIIQAQREDSLADVAVIAAAISIQDPRERPSERQDEADAMHAQFVDKRSDFLTLLNIWKTYHARLDELKTQGAIRRFCRSHFLSYMRMREWRDIHTQIRESLRAEGDFDPKSVDWDNTSAGYDAVHRAILSGLLSNIARKKEHNLYQAARNREVMVFPGSGLFQRKAPRGAEAEKEKNDKTPHWVLAAEMVETSRLFARTVAHIKDEWLLELGQHLCTFSYRDPMWNQRSGRVLVRETVRIYGLEIDSRAVAHRKIDPKAATEIFIREGLLGEDQIRQPHKFLAHNHRLCDKIETWQTRLRGQRGIDVDQQAAAYYTAQLDDISSVHDLNRLIKSHHGEPDFLFMSEKDLLGEEILEYDRTSFPDALLVDGRPLDLEYAFRPGRDEDGVTVKIPYKLVDAIDQQVLEWLVPGLLEEKITFLLRSLPKATRKLLVPIPDKARRIAAELKPTEDGFVASLAAHVRQEYGVRVRPTDWNLAELPEHLRMRVAVESDKGKTVVSGRDLGHLNARLEKNDTPVELDAWKKAAAEWDRFGIDTWDFGDLPERIEVSQAAGVPLYGFPGLDVNDAGVALRLFKSRTQATKASRLGLMSLYEKRFGAELAWLGRELKELNESKLYFKPLTPQEFRQDAYNHLLRYLFDRPQLYPLTQKRFEEGAAIAQARFSGLGPRFTAQVKALLETRQQLRLQRSRDEELQRLLPPHFLREVPFERLGDLRRYLKALEIRAERAGLDPAKDSQRAAQVAAYQAQYNALNRSDPSDERRTTLDDLRWMLEEYRVSLFAQQLGTAQPVSPKRLDRLYQRLEGLA
jgi:ATP-dependent helicase HrpA